MYTPIQSERPDKQSIYQIECRIGVGDLEVSNQLPSEREFAEQLIVSQTVVCEVVKALLQNPLILILINSIIDLLREERKHIGNVCNGFARG